MTWTECPRCQGEVGNWCGGQCHEGGLYICEHCGNAEEENAEDCPCCGKPDEDMRGARLKQEADEGNAESAAELYAILSGDMDKTACRMAFLAGVKYAEGGAAAVADRRSAMAELESRGVDVAIFLARVADVVQKGFDAAMADIKTTQKGGAP